MSFQDIVASWVVKALESIKIKGVATLENIS